MEELKVDLPYPKITDFNGVNNIEKTKTAITISPAYAGLEGELTAICGYTYHGYFFEQKNMEEYANVIKSIAVNEMHHLEILGNLLLNLGVKPQYLTTLPNGNYYNSSKVSISTSVKSMLLDDISGEINAIQEYNEIISKLECEEVINVVKRIVLDEQLHLATLKDLYKKTNT